MSKLIYENVMATLFARHVHLVIIANGVMGVENVESAIRLAVAKQKKKYN